MVGLILSLIYFGWEYFVQKAPLIATFETVTGFLWSWYVFWAVVVGILYIVIILLLSLGAGIGAMEKLGPIGGLLGFVAGGTVSALLIVIKYVMQYGSFLLGVYLVQGSLNGETWNMPQLIFGGLLLLLGLIVSTRGGSSSSSSSDS